MAAGRCRCAEKRSTDQAEAEDTYGRGERRGRHRSRLAYSGVGFIRGTRQTTVARMAAQRVGNKSPSVSSIEDLDGFAVAVTREDGLWKCRALSDAALTSLETAVTELRELRSSGAVFGLLNVDD